ncbi:UNVERIFIED_CONTAM: hypothetical protein NCL1_36294 [Trichonephila clavipes]
MKRSSWTKNTLKTQKVLFQKDG